MFVKICGINSAPAAEAAVAGGADAVGFVFADSPREVTPERALELSAVVPRTVLRVAVMHHPAPELWRRVLDVFAPDWLQTDAEDFASNGLREAIEGRCSALPVYRNGAAVSSSMPARLLFEGAKSGTGRTANWDAARALAARSEVILAGGLDAANVEDALRTVHPWGVDVSSGVERRRGEKDPGKIREFIARVRAFDDGARPQPKEKER